jgi:hypothetical protein
MSVQWVSHRNPAIVAQFGTAKLADLPGTFAAALSSYFATAFFSMRMKNCFRAVR